MSERKTVWGEAVAQYVAARIGKHIVAPYAAIGVEIDGKIAGGVVINHWTGPDAHLTVASEPRAWSSGFLADLGQHLFGKLGCERVTVITEQRTVAKIALKLGGQIEGRMRNHFGADRDGVVIGILKTEWAY